MNTASLTGEGLQKWQEFKFMGLAIEHRASSCLLIRRRGDIQEMQGVTKPEETKAKLAGLPLKARQSLRCLSGVRIRRKFSESATERNCR